MKYQQQRLWTSSILILARKHVPVPALSKENTRSVRAYLIKHRDRSVMGDLQSHLEPCPPFSTVCWRLCQRREWAGWRKLRDTSLLASLPLTPLPLKCLDCVLALRRSSFPSVTPKAASHTFKGTERKKVAKEKEQTAYSTGHTSLPREQRSAPAYLFAIHKENQLVRCHCQQVGPPNSRYLTPKRHRQLSLLSNLKTTPSQKK